jgi:hypothetical protein
MLHDGGSVYCLVKEIPSSSTKSAAVRQLCMHVENPEGLNELCHQSDT